MTVHICQQKFKDTKTGGRTFDLPPTGHLLPLMQERYDELVKEARDKNWSVIRDIVAVDKLMTLDEIQEEVLRNE